MSSDKFNQLVNDKRREIDVVQQYWFKISSRDTYLLHDEKQEFYNKLNSLAKFPRAAVFSFGKRKTIRNYRKRVHGILDEINNPLLKDEEEIFTKLWRTSILALIV